VLGTLSIYAPTPNAFDDEERKLLTKLAENLAYGIKSLREGIQLRSGQESLRVTAERLGVALRASRLGIWCQNLITRESEFDPRTFEIFGLTPTPTAPGFERILALVHEEDRSAVEHSWLGSPEQGKDHHLRFRILTGDGGVRHIKMDGIVHTDAQGRPLTSVGIVGDVTDIVESAGESARLRAQLVQSQKMESPGNLAAGVAHDFNNLLTSITLFLEMAAIQVAGNQEAAGLLAEARRGALNARDLVGLILDYSRRREGAGRSRVDLNRIVRDFTPLIAAATPASVRVTAELCPSNLMVVADPCEIQQILMNLCVNGAHALEGKRGMVKMSLSWHEIGPKARRLRVGECAPGSYARLTVTDSGCGMDEALLGKVFEPLFTTKQEKGGTGLGLAIVRDVVTRRRSGRVKRGPFHLEHLRPGLVYRRGGLRLDPAGRRDPALHAARLQDFAGQGIRSAGHVCRHGPA